MPYKEYYNNYCTVGYDNYIFFALDKNIYTYIVAIHINININII